MTLTTSAGSVVLYFIGSRNGIVVDGYSNINIMRGPTYTSYDERTYVHQL